MDISSITPESVAAQGAALTASAFGMGVQKKVIQMAQTEGAELVKLIESAGGVGRNVSTYA